ncbi:MAG: hypothetical protein FDZ69_11595 [Deltaproteobacteria bacterium]|nr:MAG: hypothetical protein FDZ69_11595 [Deltaproteobacteria bacterium]
MEVTKVRCIVERAGLNVGHFDADMIFISDIPHVVFEWEPQSDGTEKPVHLVALDPQKLHPLPGWGEVTHLYELPVKDPRNFA